MVDNAEVFVQELMTNFNISKDKALAIAESHDKFIATLAELQHPTASVMFLVSTAVGIAMHERLTPEMFLSLVNTVLVACTEDVPPTAQA